LARADLAPIAEIAIEQAIAVAPLLARRLCLRNQKDAAPGIRRALRAEARVG
jgi:hypothetical protein